MNPLPKETDIMPRATLETMARVWDQSKKDITASLEKLKETQDNLEAVFGPYMGYEDRDLARLNPEDCIKSLRRKAWRYVIDKTEIRKILSIKRAREVDAFLEEKDHPEITEEEIRNIIKSAYSNAGTFAEELVEEVFQYLRPRNWDNYKTNEKFQQAFNAKVIVGSVIRSEYGGKLRANYYAGDRLRAIDNVFHALDGKGFASTYYGELYDEIDKGEGYGETPYFRFKAYRNGNLHLEFKRLDLLKKMNQIIRERTITQQKP